MKKRKTNKRGKWYKSVTFLAAMLSVLGVIALVVCLRNCSGNAMDAATENDPTIKIEDLQDGNGMVHNGLQVEKIGSYSGIFVEDGSDDVVSRILMVIVKNVGSQTVQYAELELTDGTTTAYFTLSSLPPGESAVVMEQNRMPYSNGKTLTQCSVHNVVLFDQEPSLNKDRIQVQALNGALNITNISGQDISGNVVIYYKNAASDMLYGGITYRTTITGGISAGEVRQIIANHFYPNGSRIMWITVE